METESASERGTEDADSGTLPSVNILSLNDEFLKIPCIDFNFQTEDAKLIFDVLKETMIKNHGIGLAANQIGINRRVFVAGDYTNPDSVIGFFNPKIVDELGEEVVYEEGCLSEPDLWIKIKRPSKVRVRFTNVNGDTNTFTFEGLTARIIQHENDHLDGIVFTKRANLYHLQVARKNQKKLRRKKK